MECVGVRRRGNEELEEGKMINHSPQISKKPEEEKLII